MEPLDCRDHSCHFAEDKSGQRTNGGCRCLKEIPSDLRYRAISTFQRIYLRVRGYQVMIRNIGKQLSFAPDGDAIEIIRVDGEAPCPTCRLPYRDHPEVHATFHMICNGTTVKT